MGRISERIAQMRGCSLAQIVAEVERLEAGGPPDLFGDTLPATSTDFDAFYAAYPRKAGKPDARRAYDKARKKNAHILIMAGVARLVASQPDPQFVPYPASWLNNEGWNDAPVAVKSTNAVEARRQTLRERVVNDYGSPREGSSDPRIAIGQDRRPDH